MVVICPNCKEVVHLDNGVIIQHGSRNFCDVNICDASGTVYALDIEHFV